ncbi:MAG: extracellular solute-binding protein [Clostridiales bacterium]|nr:extracellular solute-binding protein [Clostridiales bacterium]
MKQSKTRKLAALVLGISMLITTAGCKKKNQQESSGAQAGSGSAPIVKQEVHYVQETDPYFSDTEVDFPLPVDENRKLEGMFVRGLCFAGDVVAIAYQAGYIFSDEEKAEYEKLDVRRSPEELLRYFEMQATRQQENLCLYALDGMLISEIDLEPFEAVDTLFATTDGRLGVLSNVTKYEIDEDSNAVNESHGRRLMFFSANGERQEEYAFTGLEIFEAFGSQILEISNGNLLVLNGQEIIIMSKDGTILGSDTFDAEGGCLLEKDGKYYVLMTKWIVKVDKDEEHRVICQIDETTGTLSSKQEISLGMPMHVFGSEGEFYGASEDDGGNGNIYRCDVIGGTSELAIDYSYTDVVKPTNIQDIRVKGNDYYLLYTDYEGSGPSQRFSAHLMCLHKEEKNPHAGKPIVYAATCSDGVYGGFGQTVRDYNKRPESKARVVLYVEPADPDMGYAMKRANAADKMILSMKSGTGPDVLLNCAEFSQFNTDALLLDLNPYMDGNNGIDRSQYFDNIFRAFEVGGKLYQMPLSVCMDFMIGNPDLLGRPDNWDLTRFEAAVDSLGEGVFPIIGGDPRLFNHYQNVDLEEEMGIFLELLYHDMYHYVDYNQCTVNFDSDDFRSLLQIAKICGGRLTGEQLSSLRDRYDSTKYSGLNDVMIMLDGVSSLTVESYCADLHTFGKIADLCGNDPLIIGWPTSSGSGLAADATVSVGISAYSGCPDAAWDFVSFLLEPQEQILIPGLVVNRESETAVLERNVAEYEAEKELYANEIGMMTYKAPISVDLIPNFIHEVERIGTSIHTDPIIIEIVKEEAPAFFNGQKSAEEVSRAIQNRATTLVQEQGP